MNAAWAAVAVAAATVVANVLGVWWAGRTQRSLARAERLGDREIEVYVELLRWVERVDSPDPLGSWKNFKKLEMPLDLDVRVTAFARETVLERVQDFRRVWVELNVHGRSPEDNEGRFDPSTIEKVKEAGAAMDRVRDAIREITAPDTRRRPRRRRGDAEPAWAYST
jgi:hypothetical protein